MDFTGAVEKAELVELLAQALLEQEQRAAGGEGAEGGEEKEKEGGQSFMHVFTAVFGVSTANQASF